MIKLQIVGNLGKDCIVKEVGGKNVINFSVVHSERYKDSQGVQKERATWVECAYWTDKTGIVPYLTKGRMVYAEGTPEADAYTNKDGHAAATLRMRVQTVQLLGGNGGDQSGSNSSQNSNQHSGQQSSGNSGFSNSASTAGAAQNAGMAIADDLPF